MYQNQMNQGFQQQQGYMPKQKVVKPKTELVGFISNMEQKQGQFGPYTAIDFQCQLPMNQSMTVSCWGDYQQCLMQLGNGDAVKFYCEITNKNGKTYYNVIGAQKADAGQMPQPFNPIPRETPMFVKNEFTRWERDFKPLHKLTNDELKAALVEIEKECGTDANRGEIIFCGQFLAAKPEDQPRCSYLVEIKRKPKGGNQNANGSIV